MKTDLIFSEFYSKNKVDTERFKQYFPEASLQLYHEDNTDFIFDRAHPRAGWRMHDFNQLDKLLDSKADVAIAFDADMKIVSEDVQTIIPLARKFGLCLPCNNRHLVRVDTLKGADSDKQLDETNGTAYAFNSAIIALSTSHHLARSVIEGARRIMLEDPVRLPLALWRAVHYVGFYPCLLPPQWCVCAGDEGCGNEIILHIGHEEVKKFYGIS